MRLILLSVCMAGTTLALAACGGSEAPNADRLDAWAVSVDGERTKLAHGSGTCDAPSSSPEVVVGRYEPIGFEFGFEPTEVTLAVEPAAASVSLEPGGETQWFVTEVGAMTLRPKGEQGGVSYGACLTLRSGSSASGERLKKREYHRLTLALASGPAGQEATRLFGQLVLEDPATGEADLSGDRCSVAARGFSDALHDLYDEIERVRPPRRIQALHAEFLAAARESLRLVDRAVKDIEEGRLTCGEELNARVYDLPSTRRAQRVIDRLAGLGYAFVGQ